ncbi:hypothetical protein [Arthrobacter sp. ISL-72]|uniref:hypothetical protein n=1 Tax=Arthrobacter sp. ISL-72 TaxID=2819114 RepID=UPI001BE5F696|nr:hypothetical protein [Arthrobacter sp. ISL-72]MBT2594015.1 hypothetical protein [Arthrobacter sp. ISL-72]
MYDTKDPRTLPRPVTGFDGKAVSALKYSFVPGTASLAIQTDAGALILADAAEGDAPPRPLGAHAEMRGFIPGTTKLHVADKSPTPLTQPAVHSAINLADGSLAPFPLRATDMDATSYAGSMAIIDETGSYAQVISETRSGSTTSVVAVTDQQQTRILYRPEPEWSQIRDICLSPDRKTLAVETTAPQGVTDRYIVRPGFTEMRTEIISLDSGNRTRALPGFQPSWCS